MGKRIPDATAQQLISIKLTIKIVIKRSLSASGHSLLEMHKHERSKT